MYLSPRVCVGWSSKQQVSKVLGLGKEKKRKKRGLMYKYDILISFYLQNDSTQHKTRGVGIEEGIKYSSYTPLLSSPGPKPLAPKNLNPKTKNQGGLG